MDQSSAQKPGGVTPIQKSDYSRWSQLITHEVYAGAGGFSGRFMSFPKVICPGYRSQQIN